MYILYFCSLHLLSLAELSQLNNSLDELPNGLRELNFFKWIVPYAFKQDEDINARSQKIDDVLSNMLTGIENQDTLARLAAVTFQNYLDNNHERVCAFLNHLACPVLPLFSGV